ncbi:MAG: hypothetical protein WCG97_00475 [bacterium]
MKKHQGGFIVPFLIIVIVLLVVYIYVQKFKEAPVKVTTVEVPKCEAFKITSLKPNDQVSLPVTISGVVDNSNKGCSWTMFEGQAGTWQLLFLNNTGTWEAVNKDIIHVTDWASTTTNFSFVVDDMGLNAPSDTKMKLSISAENPSGLESRHQIIEFPFISVHK